MFTKVDMPFFIAALPRLLYLEQDNRIYPLQISDFK
jgi:hypothetical protein